MLKFRLMTVVLLLHSTASAAGSLPDPGTLGPWAVGHMEDELFDAARGDRRLPVQIWYPVDPEDAVGELVDYALAEVLDFEIGITSQVALAGVPVTRDLFRPLILFSHGSRSFNLQSIVLVETLASHGFVVVAPNHTGNSTFDEPEDLPFEDTATDRPKDISFLIDWMTAKVWDLDDPFFLRVNPFEIGVSGHSFGGFTSLAMAAGFEQSEFGPVPSDPRVRAIVPIAAPSNAFSDEELASIEIPTLLLGGTLDESVPIDPETVRAMDLISSRALYRVDIVGATHTHFAGICDFANLLLDLGIGIDFWPVFGAGELVQAYFDTCIPPAFSLDEALRIQNLYAVSFFRRHLNHDFRYQHFLLKVYAIRHEPDVAFFVGGSKFGCGVGPELALLMPLLWWVRRRSL